jgi:AraC-like DNA-binding protein
MLAVRRNPCRTRDQADHWILACSESAATRIRTVSGDLEAPAGVPFVWSMGNWSVDAAFESEPAHADQVQIYLPRGVFRALAPQLDAAGVTVLDTGFGHLLGDYMLALKRRLPDLAADECSRLAHAVLSMVGACMEPSAGQVAVARNQIDLGRMERVQQAIRRHLRSPALGSKMLCRLVGVSRSNLYRLFEDAGGVARYIQRQRLLEADEMLRDITNRRAISAIAEVLCFASASAFSRAFRHEFGCAPNEVRAAAEASLAPFPAPSIRPVFMAAYAAAASRDLKRHAPDQDHPN